MPVCTGPDRHITPSSAGAALEKFAGGMQTGPAWMPVRWNVILPPVKMILLIL
jgi:hypothetical protein